MCAYPMDCVGLCTCTANHSVAMLSSLYCLQQPAWTNPRRQSQSARPSAVLAKAATSVSPPQSIAGIPPEARANGGLPVSEAPAAFKQAFSQTLAQAFVSTDLAYPGLRLQNMDPPVFTVDNFVSPEVCQQIMDAAAKSGKMTTSQIGGQGLPGGEVSQQIRTSSTLALTREVVQSVPGLAAALDTLLTAACKLCMLDQSGMRERLFTRPEVPGQLVPELPQIARYQPGQHFLAHEDAFPAAAALQKGYQRRATLLVYLNDVEQGGSTRFERLGFEVQPKQGQALLFYPSFSGGTPDARTLHTAVDAVHEKFIFQLWLSSALPPRVQPQQPSQQPQSQSRPQASKSSKKKRK